VPFLSVVSGCDNEEENVAEVYRRVREVWLRSYRRAATP